MENKKKLFIGCGVALVVGIVAVVIIFSIFYSFISPKYRDSSLDAPFSEVVNKQLTTKKVILLIENPEIPIYEEYVYHLEDGNSYGMNPNLTIAAEIPIGTEVTIDKVELHTSGVSGTTSAYLFGKVYSEEKQQEYTFQYIWGDHHVLYENEPYWTFKLAFWQDEPLTEKYFIETR